MNRPHRMTLLATLMLGTLISSAPVHAHGDEDHSAPAALTGKTLLPRASAHSEDFEIVAVLETGRLLIFVDRTDSNQPVTQAKLEVEGIGPPAIAAPLSPGVYALALAQPLASGAHALSFTLQTPGNADLLNTSLVVPASPSAAARTALAPGETGSSAEPGALGWRLPGGAWPWLGGAALVLAALSALWQRRRPARPGL